MISPVSALPNIYFPPRQKSSGNARAIAQYCSIHASHSTGDHDVMKLGSTLDHGVAACATVRLTHRTIRQNSCTTVGRAE
jgi:hypothetical protein